MFFRNIHLYDIKYVCCYNAYADIIKSFISC